MLIETPQLYLRPTNQVKVPLCRNENIKFKLMLLVYAFTSLYTDTVYSDFIVYRPMYVNIYKNIKRGSF